MTKDICKTDATMQLDVVLEHEEDCLLVGMLDTEGQALLADAVAENDPANFEKYPEVMTRSGKVGRQNRYVRFLCDPTVTQGYFYSKTVALSHMPGRATQVLLQYVNRTFGANFNAVLCNHYPSGADYSGDQSDDERGLDRNVGVLVLSVGATRTMAIKRSNKAPKDTPEFKRGGFKVPLKHNSVAIMRGPLFQSKFSHGIPVEKKVSGWRTSFTFRTHNDEHDARGLAEAELTAARIEKQKKRAREES